ncbi:MAG: glycosyltransferase [Anaerolinea sp.]|nr:glycosyltransferase [Anaerolinea sp.]
MNLVVIPFHDWKKCEREGFRTRDAHFMQEFEKHPLVDRLVVINRPISLAEMILLRRNWKPKQGTTIYQQGDLIITQVSPKTYTVDILIRELIKPLRMKRDWVPSIFGHEKVIDAVRLALTHLDVATNYALFISAPLFAPLVKALSPPLFAFDAQDNLLKHALYQDVPDLLAYYEYCLAHADFVSSNSAETAVWFKQYRPDVAHIPNGVDNTLFNRDHLYPRPVDMAAIPAPVVGYAGKMQEMFDVSLMQQCLADMPDVQFVFIGQQLNPNWVKPLWQFNNAHYLGDKPYQQLPQYLSAFDICIIPYHMTRQHGGDPIKFYEYLAMENLIVTTNIGNVTAFADYPQVCIAHSATEFVNGLKEFVHQSQQRMAIPRFSVPSEHLWRHKADLIIHALTAQNSAITMI